MLYKLACCVTVACSIKEGLCSCCHSGLQQQGTSTMHIFACPDFGMNRLSLKHVGALAQKAEVSNHHIRNYSFFLSLFIISVMMFDQHRSFHKTQDFFSTFKNQFCAFAPK